MRKLPRLSATRIVILLAAAVVGYVIFTAAGDALLSQRLGGEEQQLEREIDDLARQQQQLDTIREYLRSDEYIEAIARRTLGYVRPGETLFTVTSSAEPTPTPEGGALRGSGAWWEELYQSD